MKTQFQIAQVNIARLRAPLDDPLLAGFVEKLEDINGLADSSPGFVWRLKTDAGDATSLRPYDDKDRLEYLRTHGESAHAFSFAKLFPAPDSSLVGPVIGFADPCPAA